MGFRDNILFNAFFEFSILSSKTFSAWITYPLSITSLKIRFSLLFLSFAFSLFSNVFSSLILIFSLSSNGIDLSSFKLLCIGFSIFLFEFFSIEFLSFSLKSLFSGFSLKKLQLFSFSVLFSLFILSSFSFSVDFSLLSVKLFLLS